MKRTFISILWILALLLAGCDAATPKTIRTFRLQGDPNAPYIEDSLVGVAVGKDGMKYYAWDGCDAMLYRTHCSINVTWTKAGERHDLLVVQQPEHTYDGGVDITVTDDGMVYLVWTRYKIPYNDGNSIACWAKFDPHSPGTVTCHDLATSSLSQNFAALKIASYGNFVYAVYEAEEPNPSGNHTDQLYYRQLNPLDHSGGMANSDITVDNYNPAIAVSSAGTLHVAWIEFDRANLTQKFSYANNGSGSGDLRKVCPCISRPFTSLTFPAIGIAPLDDDRVYEAYVYSDNELITVTYPNDGSQTGVEGSPLPGWNWANMGDPALAVYDEPGNSTAFFAFSARSDSSPEDDEIYLRQWNADPAAQTDNDIDDVAPQIVLLKDNTFFLRFILVLGWVEWVSNRGTAIIEETWPLSQAQIIATAGDDDEYYGPELAGNSPYIGGLWFNYTGGRWILNAALNVHQITLPIILR